MNDIFTVKIIMMNLSQVKAGTKVKIKSFENDEIILKLMEMGCLPGRGSYRLEKSPFRRSQFILWFLVIL